MKRDYLDEAIDQVATRLVRVEDDDRLSTRILESLPDRSPWILRSWIPRLAVTAVLAIGVSLVVLRPFDGGSTDVLRSAVLSSPTVQLVARAAVAEHRTDVEPPQIVRRTIVERPQNDRRTIDAPDFERSLQAIEAVAALSVVSLAPVSLPEDAPLTLEPLAIADLPLTAEFISPR